MYGKSHHPISLVFQLLHKMKYSFFLYSFTLLIQFMLLCEKEQKLLSKTRISLGQNDRTKHIFCVMQSGLTKTLTIYISVLVLFSLQN